VISFEIDPQRQADPAAAEHAHAIIAVPMSEDPGYNTHPELPELYDHVPLYTSRRDLDFYVDLCREAGEAVELGCGTGRVLIPAAQAGCRIIGLDQSRMMLARCRANTDLLSAETRARITLVEADMTRFHLGQRFQLAIVPFRPICHLTTAPEQLDFLQCVREHLVHAGRLVFDVFNPNLAMLAADISAEEIEDIPELTPPDGRRLRRTYRIVRKRPSDQCNDVELIYYLDGRRLVQPFPFRYFFRFELEHLLARSGFEVTALYGAFDRSAFTNDSAEMIFIATRA
jgi:SAM-dependent methyltransferase